MLRRPESVRFKLTFIGSRCSLITLDAIRIELSLRLLHRHLLFLTGRVPTRPDLSEPVVVTFLTPVRRLECLAELLLLDRLQLAEVRRQGGTEVGVQRKAEELPLGADRLVGMRKDLGQRLQDRFDVDGLRAEAAGGSRSPRVRTMSFRRACLFGEMDVPHCFP